MRAALMTSAFVTGYMGKTAVAISPNRTQPGHIPAPVTFHGPSSRLEALNATEANRAAVAAAKASDDAERKTNSIFLPGPGTGRTTSEVQERDRLQALADSIGPEGAPSWMNQGEDAPAADEYPDADHGWSKKPAAAPAPVVDPTIVGRIKQTAVGAIPDPGPGKYITSQGELRHGAGNAAAGDRFVDEEEEEGGWNWNNQYTRGAVGGFGVGAGVSALLDWSRDKPVSVKRMLLVGILGGAGNTIFRALGGWDGLKETVGGWTGPQGKKETMPYKK